ncbi:MAG: hypothetical protein ACFE8E_06495 [Candidatus Hodarchaeota archaeon]
MKIPIGIEGDYIETHYNNLFFDVKGIHHPSDRKICFIRFYPSSDGDRIKNGKKYKKVYDLKERYSLLKNRYPNYIFFSKQLDVEVQGVKNEEIKKIYTPHDYYQELCLISPMSQLEKCSKELCELFIEKGGVPHNSIGITGSQMIGLSRDQSDIDLIIYGTDISRNFQENLKNIFRTHNYCRKYTQEEYFSHYKWRVGDSNIPFDKFLQYERRKLHQGTFRGFEFFIRYLKSPNDWEGTYYDYLYKNMGRIKLKAEIVDDLNAIFTPCSYKIRPIRTSKIKTKTYDVNLDEVNEVASYRGRFCEQAMKGEKVMVEGKLERVIFKKKKEYYRILLTDQIHDKMIII